MKIEVLVDDKNKPWFKKPHVGEFLGLADIRTSIRSLDKCEIQERNSFESARHIMPGDFKGQDHVNF